ncbi:MAG: HD domain-containing protein [Vicinamibacteria bacterium]|nr:HD domain-containing protein [Vicinamibacteria bacterium]
MPLLLPHPAPPSPASTDSAPENARPTAVIDMGSSAIRLVVAEAPAGRPIQIIEEASRGVLLGKDTFTNGRLGVATVEAALKTLEGFRRIMDSYGVQAYRAVATSAVREAQNCDAFLDRVRLRTGLEVEVVDGSEENRLTYIAVREALKGHEALKDGDTLLVEVGGGSADISFLRKGEPIHSGTYALGAIRMRQNLASWHGPHEHKVRLLKRHVHNVVEDIRREMPLKQARHFIALGGDMRFVAARVHQDGAEAQDLPVDAFLKFCDEVMAYDVEALVEHEQLPPAEAETLVPALVTYRELLGETSATRILTPEASLRLGLLLDLAHSEEGRGIEDFSKQVLSSAAALGERYRHDTAHGQHVALLCRQIFDGLLAEHGLSARQRLLLEVAAVLHDVGIYVSLRGHHKHTQYILSVSEIFGLSRDDLAAVSNIARYHRRALPQKSHLPYMALERTQRVHVDKMAAILRLANALDADHLQKVRNVRVVSEEGAWVIEMEGAGDLTIERLMAQTRADFFSEVFGRRVVLRESEGRA